MQEHLQEFYRDLLGWKGSLVKVEHIPEPHAKEYLGKLAKHGVVERIVWGWYWIPDRLENFWDFLKKDRNFKVVAGQTAASFWNHDFIHREVYLVRVKDPSYGKALKAFADTRGWNVVVELAREENYTKKGSIYIQTLESCVIDCMQRWAFADAFAVLYGRRYTFRSLAAAGYWKRISRTEVRIRQALSYGCHRINELRKDRIFPVRKARLEDRFVRREIDEAVEKVVGLG